MLLAEKTLFPITSSSLHQCLLNAYCVLFLSWGQRQKTHLEDAWKPNTETNDHMATRDLPVR